MCVGEGYPNACSKLYARCQRIAHLMGFQKVITYTLAKESQSSLKAIGAVPISRIKPQTWNRKNRPRTDQKVYKEEKMNDQKC